MKKYFTAMMFLAAGLFAQQKVTLKDSTLFNMYNQRLAVLSDALQRRMIYIAQKDTTCREINTAMNEVKLWLNEEVRKQTIEKK